MFALFANLKIHGKPAWLLVVRIVRFVRIVKFVELGRATLADALVLLASDPALRARMGAAGRGRVEAEFRLDAQIASFSDLLHEAAGR